MGLRRFLQFVAIGGVLAAASELQSKVVLVTLRAVREPSKKEQLLEPPESDAEVCLGDDLYAEVWVTELGENASGIAGGSVNVLYEPTLLEATGIQHSDVFGAFVSGTINPAMQRVENLGGATLDSGVGENPQWALLGRVRFDVAGLGSMTLSLSPGFFRFALAEGGPPLDFGTEVRLECPQALEAVAFLRVGDMDCDTDIDLDDWRMFQQCMTGPMESGSPPLPDACLAADTDADSDIDLRDFSLVQRNWMPW